MNFRSQFVCKGLSVALICCGAIVQAQIVVAQQHNAMSASEYWRWSDPDGDTGHGQLEHLGGGDGLTSFSQTVLASLYGHTASQATITTTVAANAIAIDGTTSATSAAFTNNQFYYVLHGSASATTTMLFQTTVSGSYFLSASTSHGTVDFKKDGLRFLHLEKEGSASFRGFFLEAGHTYEVDASETSTWYGTKQSACHFSLHQ